MLLVGWVLVAAVNIILPCPGGAVHRLSTGNSLSLTDVGKYLQNNLTQHYMVCALCILLIQNVQAHTGATATVTRNRRCALHTVQG